MLSLVEPQLKDLSNLWLKALKDQAILKLPVDVSNRLPEQGITVALFYFNAFFYGSSCQSSGLATLMDRGSAFDLLDAGSIPAWVKLKKTLNFSVYCLDHNYRQGVLNLRCA